MYTHVLAFALVTIRSAPRHTQGFILVIVFGKAAFGLLHWWSVMLLTVTSGK